MKMALNYIKQKENIFGVASPIFEFLIYFMSGLVWAIKFFIAVTNGSYDDIRGNFLFLAIVLLLCSFVFPLKQAVESHRGKKVISDYLWIVKLLLTLLVLINSFVFMGFSSPIDYIVVIVSEMVFFVFSCVKLFCMEIKKFKYIWLGILLHTMTMIPIAAILANGAFVLKGYHSIRSWGLIMAIVLGVLEIVFYAFVYIGISRWVCPECRRINKGKAKFCVGCGKVRPEQPKPVRKPRPAPVYAAPAPQPTAVTPQPQAAAPLPEGTDYCSECGAPIDPGAVFCGQCGKPVN